MSIWRTYSENKIITTLRKFVKLNLNLDDSTIEYSVKLNPAKKITVSRQKKDNLQNRRIETKKTRNSKDVVIADSRRRW